MEDIVPNHIGLNHITRENFIRLHTKDMAKALFTESKDIILNDNGSYFDNGKNNDANILNSLMTERSYSTLNVFSNTQISYIGDYIHKDYQVEKIQATSITDIPRLTFQVLYRITIGIYSYARKHGARWCYVLYMHKQKADILKLRLQFRHISSKQYHL
ncbi:hypothetical protein ALC53_03210 [Atta colombica]|uniref:Uncharacterized protein n=1 Tax=Atta colombica TaxID=520822 RepID=A0A151I5H9_9HYME|nr:hypothetical protein ALC53_03210 [Atta colombica]